MKKGRPWMPFFYFTIIGNTTNLIPASSPALRKKLPGQGNYHQAFTSATDIKTLMATDAVYIINIRSATDFADGHIEGAHHVAAGDVLSHVEGINTEDCDKVVIVF